MKIKIREWKGVEREREREGGDKKKEKREVQEKITFE